MAAKLRYTLNDFNNIIFNGFNYELPAETIRVISELALEVGSPDYVKTPIFQKRENPMKSDVLASSNPNFKKKKGKNMEINDGDWEALRTFKLQKLRNVMVLMVK